MKGMKLVVNGIPRCAEEEIHPSYYRTMAYVPCQCLHVIRFMPFSVGSAIKYIWRAGLKGDYCIDMKKALFYLDDYVRNPVDWPDNSGTIHAIWGLVQKPLQDDVMNASKWTVIDLIVNGNYARARDLVSRMCDIGEWIDGNVGETQKRDPGAK